MDQEWPIDLKLGTLVLLIRPIKNTSKWFLEQHKISLFGRK